MTVEVSAWTSASLCTERNEGEDDTHKDSGIAWLLLVCMCVQAEYEIQGLSSVE